MRAHAKMTYKRLIAPATVSVLTALAAGCGSSGGAHFANQPRPPSPVNLTVYINDQRVSLSPANVGAGPIVFIVTNQSTRAESLSILPAGEAAGQPLANTGPISPMATAQVKVSLSSGAYTVASTSSAGTEAAQAVAPQIQPALLRIGPSRPSSSGQLLIP